MQHYEKPIIKVLVFAAQDILATEYSENIGGVGDDWWNFFGGVDNDQQV